MTVAVRRTERDSCEQAQDVTASEDVQVESVDTDGSQQQQQQLVSAGCGCAQRPHRRSAVVVVRQLRVAAVAGARATRQYV